MGKAPSILIPPSILILGGTTEARLLAGRLAVERNDCAITLSLAGRTRNPVDMPAPVISGGFGGAEGLAHYLRDHGVTLLIDATHPFAAIMSSNAERAASDTGVPLIALRRPEWQRQPGDRWTEVASGVEAISALGDAPRRVFLSLGRQEAHVADAAPQHRYVVRSVEPIEPPLVAPDVRYILDRGPFAPTSERSLLTAEGIDAIIAKNSGGSASHAKIVVARELGIEVILIGRPPVPQVPSATGIDEAMAMMADHLPLTERGA